MSALKILAEGNSINSAGDTVMVAVRVRPFTERELQRQEKLIIQMPDKQITTIIDLNNNLPPRTFAFDYSYWSHDGFVADENGYLHTRSKQRYADQKEIFTDLGMELINNAWKGYNCSLFAYGQTGSGKSYSVMGFNQNQGIVPRFCNELFRRIEELHKTSDDNQDYLVSISMMEIYCEKVRDLLATKPLQRSLKVREHPKIGFYVENLSKFIVQSKRDIERKIMEGTRNRTIASTQMNEISSRAHMIIRINFLQKQTKMTANCLTKSSEINIVDLAGSERLKSSRSEGDRLKEGVIINKSLSVLGRVIKTLHENQQLQSQIQLNASRLRPAQVPYRDSVLTCLLKNALGGNSKTIMLATISPAASSRDETLATLRFADCVKNIRTRPIVNESVIEYLLRELRDENSHLLELITQSSDAVTEDELTALKDQLIKNEKELTTLEKNWQLRYDQEQEQKKSNNLPNSTKLDLNTKTKIQQNTKRGKSKLNHNINKLKNDADVTSDVLTQENSENDGELSPRQLLERRRHERPHFWNLNEDPSLTEVLIHFIEPGENRIGSAISDGIFNTSASKIVLRGLSILPEHAVIINKENRSIVLRPLNSAEILVNGRVVTGDQELQQNDRVYFGGNHLYVFANPYRPGMKSSMEIGYEAAQREIAKNFGTMLKFKKRLNSETDFPRILSEEEAALEEQLINILPDVYRANAMAKALKRDIHFEIVLLLPEMRAANSNDGTEIWVKVQDNEQDTNFLWDYTRFASRYLGMQEIYAAFIDGDNKEFDLPKERDPFYEPANTPTIIGTVRVFLRSLAYMIELDEQFPIVDVHGTECGQLCVSLTPCNVTGKEILGEFVENPEELINQNLAFKVKILSALSLPRRIEASYCTYSFFKRDMTCTNNATGNNPAYAHEQLFTFRPVSKELVNYLLDGTLIIIVNGIQKSKNIELHSETTAQRISAYFGGADTEQVQSSPTIVLRKPLGVETISSTCAGDMASPKSRFFPNHTNSRNNIKQHSSSTKEPISKLIKSTETKSSETKKKQDINTSKSSSFSKKTEEEKRLKNEKDSYLTKSQLQNIKKSNKTQKVQKTKNVEAENMNLIKHQSTRSKTHK